MSLVESYSYFQVSSFAGHFGFECRVFILVGFFWFFSSFSDAETNDSFTFLSHSYKTYHFY